MTAIMPAPAYVLARAAWISKRPSACQTTRFDPCGDYAAALAASWRLRPAPAGA
jgi:hypothetical protein